MKLVLDTNVAVAAMGSPSGASAAILREIREGGATLVLTVSLAMEYEAICRRPEHRRAAGLPAREADIFVDAVTALAQPVETHFLWRPQLHDPNDEMVLEAAVNGMADVLVTFNTKGFGGVPRQFGIAVLPPRDALQRMKK